MSQYLKPDSELGFVEDHAVIEFLQFNNLRHTILGCMLGDFNEVGNYVVAPEIVEELISMEKFVVQTYDNIELCRSCLKLDKQISFMVTFEGNRATLTLIEKLNYEANFKLNSGTYSNINEYVLDSIETSGEVNRSVIYDKWNIKLMSGDMVDIFNCDEIILEKYFGIVNRFKYLLESNKVLLQKEEELEEVEASYSNELLAILKHYPKLEKAVMQTIKETLEEKKDAVSIKKPFFAKTFNEVLENAIEKNISVLDETEQKEFAQEKRNVVVNVNIKREDVLDIEKVETTEDKKETTPKVIQIKTQPSYESKPVEELGDELVSINKEVSKNLNDDKEELESSLIRSIIETKAEEKGESVVIPKTPEKEKVPQPEKEKLLATIVGAGLGAVIGGTTGAVVGAVAGAVVAEVAQSVEENKQQTKNTKRNNQTQTVRAAVKSSGSTNNKSQSGGVKQRTDKVQSGGVQQRIDKVENNKNQKQQTVDRIFSVHVPDKGTTFAGVDSSSGNEERPKIKKTENRDVSRHNARVVEIEKNTQVNGEVVEQEVDQMKEFEETNQQNQARIVAQAAKLGGLGKAEEVKDGQYQVQTGDTVVEKLTANETTIVMEDELSISEDVHSI